MAKGIHDPHRAGGEAYPADRGDILAVDMLAMDRHGISISGGVSDTNTPQQGHDLPRIIAALRTGDGFRGLSRTAKSRWARMPPTRCAVARAPGA